MFSSLTRRLAPPAALLGLALTAASAQAAPQTVIGGNLNWSTAKLWAAAATTPVTDRTFVGFATRNTSPGHQNMTLAPALGGPMWGTTVSPTSAAGTQVSWNFPAVGGVYDPATKVGTVSLTGQLLGDSPYLSANIGFNYKLTIKDPVVVFDGTDTASLYAEGTKYGGTFQPNPTDNTVPYSRVKLFTLDLRQMTETQNPDGTTTLSNLAPTVATDIYGGFPVGVAGPDRTPNTFGSFALTVVTPQGAGANGAAGTNGTNGAPGPAGPVGPAGKNGAAGKKGSAGKKGAAGKSTTRVVAHLAKAPWTGNATRKVSLLKGKSVVASGSVKKKTLTVTVAKGKKVSTGAYTLKLQGAKTKKAIRIG